MSYMSLSDKESEPSSIAPSSTATPSIDPGDTGSIFEATVASRAPVTLLQSRPRREGRKRTYIQAQLSVSGVISNLYYIN
jgi:hypothetical protein